VSLFFVQSLANKFLNPKRIQLDIVINVKTSSWKLPVILSQIRPVWAHLFHADGQTDMKKLTVAFRNFAKVA
jgi:hypothetical protein